MFNPHLHTAAKAAQFVYCGSLAMSRGSQWVHGSRRGSLSFSRLCSSRQLKLPVAASARLCGEMSYQREPRISRSVAHPAQYGPSSLPQRAYVKATFEYTTPCSVL